MEVKKLMEKVYGKFKIITLVLILILSALPLIIYAPYVKGFIESERETAWEGRVTKQRDKILDSIRESETLFSPGKRIAIDKVEFQKYSYGYAYISYRADGEFKKVFGKFITNDDDGNEKLYLRKAKNYFLRTASRWDFRYLDKKILTYDVIETLGVNPLWNIFAYDNEKEPLELIVFIAMTEFEYFTPANITLEKRSATYDLDAFIYNLEAGRWEAQDISR